MYVFSGKRNSQTNRHVRERLRFFAWKGTHIVPVLPFRETYYCWCNGVGHSATVTLFLVQNNLTLLDLYFVWQSEKECQRLETFVTKFIRKCGLLKPPFQSNWKHTGEGIVPAFGK